MSGGVVAAAATLPLRMPLSRQAAPEACAAATLRSLAGTAGSGDALPLPHSGRHPARNNLSSHAPQVRAGTGGEEAALWAADLIRMYQRYAETQGWKVALVSESSAEAGGYKECILEISGEK